VARAQEGMDSWRRKTIFPELTGIYNELYQVCFTLLIWKQHKGPVAFTIPIYPANPYEEILCTKRGEPACICDCGDCSKRDRTNYILTQKLFGKRICEIFGARTQTRCGSKNWVFRGEREGGNRSLDTQGGGKDCCCTKWGTFYYTVMVR